MSGDEGDCCASISLSVAVVLLSGPTHVSRDECKLNRVQIITCALNELSSPAMCVCSDRAVNTLQCQ